jgi:hypothetical protein
VRVVLYGVQPIFDALLDGVGSRRTDSGLYLLVELVELVFDILLGLAAHGVPVAFAIALEAERDRTGVALVGLVPRMPSSPRSRRRFFGFDG